MILEKPQQNPEVKSQNNQQELTKENLNLMLCEIKKGNVSKEKMEHIVDYVLKLAQIESKYSGQKDKIKKDVRFFIENSVKNTLNSHLGEYNISKFDVDGQAGLDKVEEENYSRAIGESIGQIIIFGGIEKFSKIYSESNGPGGFTGAYKYIANSLDMGRFFGNTKDKHFMESLIQKYGMISETQLKEMQEKTFDITSKESRGDLAILLFKEFGDGTQDVLRFLGNIPSGLILIPLYTKYRIQANSNDPQTKAEAEIKLKELIEQNPSLAILEMLGEKGLEMFKHLGGMLTSGKQGDIAMASVTIAGLVAGGAGLTKFSLNLARKSAVKSARLAGREARIAGSTTSQATRTSLKIGAKKVSKVAEVADRIDDVVGGAGIGHLTGAFGSKIKKAENHSGISRELVLENAKLSDTNRLKKASELLGKKLTPEQEQAIIFIHEEISKGVYQNEYVDIRKMVEELDKVGISRKDGRKLMENGLLGVDSFQFNGEIFQLSSVIQDTQTLGRPVNVWSSNSGKMYGYFYKKLGREITSHISPSEIDMELGKIGSSLADAKILFETREGKDLYDIAVHQYGNISDTSIFKIKELIRVYAKDHGVDLPGHFKLNPNNIATNSDGMNHMSLEVIDFDFGVYNSGTKNIEDITVKKIPRSYSSYTYLAKKVSELEIMREKTPVLKVNNVTQDIIENPEAVAINKRIKALKNRRKGSEKIVNTPSIGFTEVSTMPGSTKKITNDVGLVNEVKTNQILSDTGSHIETLDRILSSQEVETILIKNQDVILNAGGHKIIFSGNSDGTFDVIANGKIGTDISLAEAVKTYEDVSKLSPLN